ncbi:hypothetical protein [Endozoicomonas sp. YOMI1]|uniref:hypothetical protein n=1 Tax=Endozoicomonas sp. YOMI1 TaxID=2828739 RepID=UPI0021491880|nr:hypothetical protein [Endozoicomonas sp. YOMI1]
MIRIQELDIPVTPHNSYKTAVDYVLNLHELGFEELHYVHIHVKWILYFPCKTTVQDDSEVMPDCDIVHSAELL